MRRTVPSNSYLLRPNDLNSLALDKLRREGDPYAAISIWRQYVANHPDDAAGWGNLGAGWLEAGEHRDAVECLKRAIELNPDLLEPRAALILVMQYSGDFSRAEVEEEIRKYGELVRSKVVPDTSWPWAENEYDDGK